jgi:hypothetical protein
MIEAISADAAPSFGALYVPGAASSCFAESQAESIMLCGKDAVDEVSAGTGVS